jgi:hypothetical protein
MLNYAGRAIAGFCNTARTMDGVRQGFRGRFDDYSPSKGEKRVKRAGAQEASKLTEMDFACIKSSDQRFPDQSSSSIPALVTS